MNKSLGYVEINRMGKLLFFVDDDKVILNLLEYTLNNEYGYEVKTFLSGEECLENLPLKPDLIVLDHFLNTKVNINMDGLETLIKIRHIYKDLPVIILTSVEDEALASEYLKHGATQYIPKNNFFVDSLIQSIGQYI